MSEIQDYPSSYYHNTEKEEITLAFVENVRQQFQLIFPKRAELFLCPFNECGIQKFISTTICPTVLPFPELYELEGCIKFVADRIDFQPLEDIFKMPTTLVSPYTTLISKAGNAFDISTLLCSLLIAAGFNAYCVVGYCNEYIARGSRALDSCDAAQPILPPKPPEKKKRVPSYTIAKRYSLRSEYDEATKKEEEEKEREKQRKIASGEMKEGEESTTGSRMPTRGGSRDAGKRQGTRDGSRGGGAFGSTAEKEEEEDDDDWIEVEVTDDEAEEEEAPKEGEGDSQAPAQVQSTTPSEGAAAETAEPPKKKTKIVKVRGLKHQMGVDGQVLTMIELDAILKAEAEKDAREKQRKMEEEKEKEEERKRKEEEERRLALIPKPVHCWVLVRPGARGVTKTMFVESTTGRSFSVTEVVRATGLNIEELKAKEKELMAILAEEKKFRAETEETRKAIEELNAQMQLATSPLASMYLGVESVYNNKNCWAALTKEIKDKGEFDISDADKWTSIMVESRRKKKKPQQPQPDLALQTSVPSSSLPSARGDNEESGANPEASNEKEKTEEEKEAKKEGEEKKEEGDKEAAAKGSEDMDEEEEGNDGENGDGMGLIEEEDEEDEEEMQDEILETPPTWVKPLELTREEHHERFPGGGKGITYGTAKEEKFTTFLNEDGLVSSVEILDTDEEEEGRGGERALDATGKDSYGGGESVWREGNGSFSNDGTGGSGRGGNGNEQLGGAEEGAVVKETREFFKNRSDFLSVRRILYKENRVICEFEPGQVDHVVSCINDETVTILNFRENGRRDGLVKREERVGKKVIEYFKGRSDRLIKRSHSVMNPDGGMGGGMFGDQHGWMEGGRDSRGGMGGMNAGNTGRGTPQIMRISDEFDVNKYLPQDKWHTCVKKRVFWLDRDELRVKVVMHPQKGYLTSDTRTFRPDEAAGGFQCDVKKADPLAARPTAIALQHEWVALGKDFSALQVAVAKADEDAIRILTHIDELKGQLTLRKSIFDTLHYSVQAPLRASDESKDKDGEAQGAFDYLAPFLKDYDTSSPLLPHQARAVVEAFKRHFQNRMHERLKVMERRRQKLEQEAVEQQEYIDKLGDHADKELLEASVQKYDEIVFSLNVAKLRLSKFKQDFDVRLKEMENKLRSDPRLSSIY